MFITRFRWVGSSHDETLLGTLIRKVALIRSKGPYLLDGRTLNWINTAVESIAPPLVTGFVQSCWHLDFMYLWFISTDTFLQNKILYLLDIWLNRAVQGSGFNVFRHQIEGVQDVKSQTLMSWSNLARWRSSFLCKILKVWSYFLETNLAACQMKWNAKWNNRGAKSGLESCALGVLKLSSRVV